MYQTKKTEKENTNTDDQLSPVMVIKTVKLKPESDCRVKKKKDQKRAS